MNHIVYQTTNLINGKIYSPKVSFSVKSGGSTDVTGEFGNALWVYSHVKGKTYLWDAMGKPWLHFKIAGMYGVNWTDDINRHQKHGAFGVEFTYEPTFRGGRDRLSSQTGEYQKSLLSLSLGSEFSLSDNDYFHLNRPGVHAFSKPEDPINRHDCRQSGDCSEENGSGSLYARLDLSTNMGANHLISFMVLISALGRTTSWDPKDISDGGFFGGVAIEYEYAKKLN